ncbi:MAG TPA: glycosyltransferase, partial [Alphaproteobacteria bacterium]|nr:glycosyltransferase [Alphaproteobacteria bacterium]
GLPSGIHGDLVSWSLESEAEAVASFAVGIAPLPDTPWNRGKCALKALLYMSCAVPVVASPVGALAEVVVDGETGFLAGGDAEWEDALNRLLSDRALRRRMGEAGRERVLSKYSIGIGAEILAKALRGEVESE